MKLMFDKTFLNKKKTKQGNQGKDRKNIRIILFNDVKNKLSEVHFLNEHNIKCSN